MVSQSVIHTRFTVKHDILYLLSVLFYVGVSGAKHRARHRLWAGGALALLAVGGAAADRCLRGRLAGGLRSAVGHGRQGMLRGVSGAKHRARHRLWAGVALALLAAGGAAATG